MKNTDLRHGGAGGSQNLNVQPGRSREMPGMLRDVLAKIGSHAKFRGHAIN